MKTALLLSGGMDSVAIAYWKKPDVAFTVDYGQLPAVAEVRAAAAVADALSIEHHVLKVDISALGSGDLFGGPALPDAPAREWLPFRNQFLVTIAAMRGFALGIQKLLLGTVATDSFHADGSAEFIARLNQLLGAQEGKMEVEAPAISMKGTDLIRASGVREELLAWAHSCHVADFACGTCNGCRKHYETLRELGREPY